MATGIDKMSLERQMADQGRKMIKERNRNSREEVQTDLFQGMQEHEADGFDKRWKRDAAPHIPGHGAASIESGQRGQGVNAKGPSGMRGSLQERRLKNH